MDPYVVTGLVLGIVMYATKYGSFCLLTSKTPRIRHYIHHSPFCLGVMDVGFVYLASHVTAGMGSIIALVGNVAFGACSMMVIVFIICKNAMQQRFGWSRKPEPVRVKARSEGRRYASLY